MKPTPHKDDVSLASGGYFDWTNIGANSHMSVYDVASGLSSTARYCGQLPYVTYNVAQHSVLVAQLLMELNPGQPQLWYMGLFHDATESLMGDATSPLKRLLPDYRRIENELHGHMARWFRFDPTHDPRIRYADLVALAIEKHVLLQNGDLWACLEDAGINHLTLARLDFPLEVYLDCVWNRDESRKRFMQMYNKLAPMGQSMAPQTHYLKD